MTDLTYLLTLSVRVSPKGEVIIQLVVKESNEHYQKVKNCSQFALAIRIIPHKSTSFAVEHSSTPYTLYTTPFTVYARPDNRLGAWKN